MKNAGLEETQAGIKIARRIINNLRYADDTTLMAESKEELDESKEESEKAGLKLNIQKTKIMASGPITSWQIDGETMETETDLIFLGSKITADGDCSHEIKRRLLLGRKARTNLGKHNRKQRHYFANKGLSSLLSSVHSLSRVRLFETPWTAARQASLSIINSQSLLECISIEFVMPTSTSSRVVPFSSCFQSFPASGSSQMSQFFASGVQSIGISASASVLQMNIQD